MNYCKRIRFGREFFLAPLVFVTLRQIKYKLNVHVSVCLSRFKSNAKSNPR